MALTTDKRRNVVSISSVSNRMGVVRGTTGDIVSEIGLTLSKQLDFFAKRQAELESVKYEADVKSKPPTIRCPKEPVELTEPLYVLPVIGFQKSGL